MKVAPALLTLMAAALAAAPSAARKKPRAAPPKYVACTKYGCRPVPAGCHPEIGYYPDGSPTGYDIVVCHPSR